MTLSRSDELNVRTKIERDNSSDFLLKHKTYQPAKIGRKPILKLVRDRKKNNKINLCGI